MSHQPKRRADIIAEAKRQKANVESLFRDCASWNDAHPHEEPIDADPDGTMACLLAYLDGILNGAVYLAPEREVGDD